MRIIRGNKEQNLAPKEFNNIRDNYKEVIIDLGTGDGRFTYTKAKETPEALVIGIDPSHKQLEKYSKKANKDRLENVLFMVASVEDLPQELKGIAKQVHINFPWGSLLGGISKANTEVTKNISDLVIDGGTLNIVFGYSQEAEPSETERLGLNELNETSIKDSIIPEFEKNGLSLVELTTLEKNAIFEIQSNWSKKLSFGQDRDIYKLTLKK